MNQQYSDLQVVIAEEEPKYSLGGPQKAWASPEPVSTEKIAVQGQAYEVSKPVCQDAEQAQASSKQRNTICGISKRVFWIVVGIAVVIVIAAAVGGGVGATLSNKNDVKSTAVMGTSTSMSTSIASTAPTSAPSSLSSQPQTPTQSATPTTQSTSVTISTTTIIGPSGTILSDCPSSNDTIYTPDSSTQMFRKLCDVSLLNVNNDAAAVTVQVSTLDDCISACAGFNLQHSSDHFCR